MKKIAISALSVLLVCSLAACGSNNDNGDTTDTQSGEATYKIETTTPVTEPPAVTTTEPLAVTTEPVVTTESPVLTFTPVDQMVFAIGNVWIRSKPEISEETKVATLSYGESLRCVGISDTWYKVIYGDKECYVSAAYLTTDNLNVALDPRDETVYVIVDTATVRLGPSTKTDAMGYLKKGDSVIRKGISAEWSQIAYNGGLYFVHNSCLDTKPAN